jgi:hypothetical protein
MAAVGLQKLPTFVSSGRRVQLLGCWLGFARGRIYTSWIASTDFIEKPLSNPNSYVTLHDNILLCQRLRLLCHLETRFRRLRVNRFVLPPIYGDIQAFRMDSN